jgi:hypothetical protein
MHSYRVLGIIALCAVVIAVFSFTVVDITIDSANGCLAARAVCREHEVPQAAIVYAVFGTVALLASIPFGAGWVVGMLRRPVPTEPHPRVLPAPRPLLLEDEA